MAGALGGEARVEHLPDAGHWPWLDRPDVVETVCDFLE
jgi:pimeloyl-ACP methyl ester carboxylesterase